MSLNIQITAAAQRYLAKRGSEDVTIALETSSSG